MHAGDMLLSNPPATAGVAGVTSVNTRTGVVTLVPSDVNITAAVDKGVVYMDGSHYANSANFEWNKTTFELTLINPTALDDSSAFVKCVATNTAALTANVEFGGESNVQGETDYVVYCHSVERLRIFGANPSAYYTVENLVVSSPGFVPATPDSASYLQVQGRTGSGAAQYATIGNLISTDGATAGEAVVGISNSINQANGPLFVGGGSLTPVGVAIGIDPNAGVYAAPLGTLHVRASSSGENAIFGQGWTGISGKFQTAITDGSNTNATTEVLGNTAQTANLTNWRGTDGTTIVASMAIDGTMTASAYLTASKQAAFVASPYGVGAGNTGEYRFLELAANGTDYVALKAPDALAGPLTYTLPAVDHVGPWMSNGSGVLSVVAGQDLTIVVPVANKTLTFTKGVLTGVV